MRLLNTYPVSQMHTHTHCNFITCCMHILVLAVIYWYVGHPIAVYAFAEVLQSLLLISVLIVWAAQLHLLGGSDIM